MLVGLTRVGPLRQRVDKCFTVTGGRQAPQAATVGGIRLEPARRDGLWYAVTPLTWLGSPDSRDAWAAQLSRAIGTVGTGGAAVLPTTVPGPGGITPAGGDVHTLEVASPAEQEVLCNLLREHVPLLVALTCRTGTVATSGSYWLATSREHVAARYLASTAPMHLERVITELRRVDGVAQLERMDVFPSKEDDGTLTVTVRCVEGASVAAARAHVLLLAALAMHARRLVQDGRRLGHLPQRRLEENRARAVARGLSSRMSKDGPGSAPVPARQLARSLLTDTLAKELDNLRATSQELFPLIAAIDLPQLGLARAATEDELLRGWAADQGAKFAGIAAHVLLNQGPGGPCLTAAGQLAPGRTSLLLDEWTAIIAARRGGVGTSGPAKRPGQPAAGSGRGDQPHRRNDQRRPGRGDNR
ncbi:hypothetical protein Cs7R123_01810 [Catellatospora sp. TT07R-123]|uniref:hypothetical protein n=1 Tax=Catellatospora sp. TT07R-123 TaxID=2733863 RepID=UPI001B0A8B65|nr:hypothetical protein [Catellatospora sp. TT07R-123]GHJ42839.1 hypothetical protein Cs7R123_01810 [Catellatospora sp. TT07R-123]